jgi:hypothetical protein
MSTPETDRELQEFRERGEITYFLAILLGS